MTETEKEAAKLLFVNAPYFANLLLDNIKSTGRELAAGEWKDMEYLAKRRIRDDMELRSNIIRLDRAITEEKLKGFTEEEIDDPVSG